MSKMCLISSTKMKVRGPRSRKRVQDSSLRLGSCSKMITLRNWWRLRNLAEANELTTTTPNSCRSLRRKKRKNLIQTPCSGKLIELTTMWEQWWLHLRFWCTKCSESTWLCTMMSSQRALAKTIGSKRRPKLKSFRVVTLVVLIMHSYEDSGPRKDKICSQCSLQKSSHLKLESMNNSLKIRLWRGLTEHITRPTFDWIRIARLKCLVWMWTAKTPSIQVQPTTKIATWFQSDREPKSSQATKLIRPNILRWKMLRNKTCKPTANQTNLKCPFLT